MSVEWFNYNSVWISVFISFFSMLIYLITAILIYRQIKDVKKSVNGSTHESIMNQASTITRIFMDNPELSDIWGTKKINELEKDLIEIKRLWVVEMLLNFFEHMYLQYYLKNLPKEMWEGWNKHIENTFKDSIYFQKHWEENRGVYSEKFQKYIDDLIREKCIDYNIDNSQNVNLNY